MTISESKKKIVIDNYFNQECDINTSIKEAFTKGFELGLKKAPISVIEDIKAEIREWYWQVDKQELAEDPCVVDAMIDLFIRTIDEHISGVSQESGRKQMTIGEFSKLIKDNNIPKDARMISDSGWECWPTDMDGIFYNEDKNEIMFTQTGDEYDNYNNYPDWRCIHSYKWTKAEIETESEE